jgi:hypothetical protein
MKLAAFALAFIFAAWALAVPPADAQASAGTYEGTESLTTVYGKIDISCILRTWKITGVFACPAFPQGVNVCVITENAYPVGIVEAVRRPWTSHLSEVDAWTKMLGQAATAALGETSSHTPNSPENTALQFTEAHVYEFVPSIDLGSLPIAVPTGSTFSISYLSEFDAEGWRSPFIDQMTSPLESAVKTALPACDVVPRPGDCAWRWGTWFPRTGFAVHPSEVMTGYLLGLRGGRVAAKPLGRVVLSKYSYEPRTGHYVQMLRPSWRSCVSIGWPITRMIEAEALSREGAYLFLQHSVFRQCDKCFPALLVEPRPPLTP